jgi:hypothetical protein
MEEREFWGSIGSLAESIGFFLSADIALAALRREDHHEMDHFSGRYLGRRLPPNELLALFQIVTRSKTWRNVNWPATPKYLGRAVWLEGQNILHERKWDGIPTPEQCEKEVRAARELDRRRTRVLRPDRELERRETSEFRAKVIERVYAAIRDTGTERDRMILDLLEKGRSPAEAISELGLKMSAWEALRRKMERWGRKERKEAENLRSEMSSRRVSAA